MKIEFEGNTFEEIVLDMMKMLMDTGFVDQVTTAPEAQTEQATGTEEPESEETKDLVDSPVENSVEEPEPEPERPASELKKEAIDILMALYSDGKAAEVKTLLKDFGVKKFGEVPDSKAKDLLSRAQDMQKEPA